MGRRYTSDNLFGALADVAQYQDRSFRVTIAIYALVTRLVLLINPLVALYGL